MGRLLSSGAIRRGRMLRAAIWDVTYLLTSYVTGFSTGVVAWRHSPAEARMVNGGSQEGGCGAAC